MVVAGVVATTDMWSGFEKKWNALTQDKPPKLQWKKYVQQHCVEFAQLARTFSLKAISFPLKQAQWKLLRADMAQKGAAFAWRRA